MNKELEVAKQIAYEAGDIMRTYFYTDQQTVQKEDGSPVTIADTTINRMVIERLAEVFPGDIVIGEEESTGEYGNGRRWFCDPIDGTKAFTWRVPTAMFSLGFVVDGRPILGVCYEPMLDKLYWAVDGKGAYCNGVSLTVSNETLQQGILATVSSPYRLRREATYMDALLDTNVEMASFSGAVAKSVRVADGTFVGYLEELVNGHDMAAVQVIVEQAGGKVTGFDGTALDYSLPFKGAIVSNSIVHDDLCNATMKR